MPLSDEDMYKMFGPTSCAPDEIQTIKPKNNSYNFTYQINERVKCLEVNAKTFTRGKSEITFVNDIFDSEKMIKEGFIVTSLPHGWFSKIYSAINNYINSKINNSNFKLDQYHTFVDNEQHNKIVNSFRGGATGLNGIPLKELGISSHDMDDFINTTVKSKSRLSCNIERNGMKLDVFWIRIVRPNTVDNNPPHKDTHIERIQKNINIYLPLAGSNEKSSLPLVPGSHMEKESEYIISSSPCFIKDKQFTVPAIVHRDKGLKMITPNPDRGEVMMFTPHLIHGGGANDNDNVTRVSLEMRFFK